MNKQDFFEKTTLQERNENFVKHNLAFRIVTDEVKSFSECRLIAYLNDRNHMYDGARTRSLPEHIFWYCLYNEVQHRRIGQIYEKRVCQCSKCPLQLLGKQTVGYVSDKVFIVRGVQREDASNFSANIPKKEDMSVGFDMILKEHPTTPQVVTPRQSLTIVLVGAEKIRCIGYKTVVQPAVVCPLDVRSIQIDKCVVLPEEIHVLEVGKPLGCDFSMAPVGIIKRIGDFTLYRIARDSGNLSWTVWFRDYFLGILDYMTLAQVEWLKVNMSIRSIPYEYDRRDVINGWGTPPFTYMSMFGKNFRYLQSSRIFITNGGRFEWRNAIARESGPYRRRCICQRMTVNVEGYVEYTPPQYFFSNIMPYCGPTNLICSGDTQIVSVPAKFDKCDYRFEGDDVLRLAFPVSPRTFPVGFSNHNMIFQISRCCDKIMIRFDVDAEWRPVVASLGEVLLCCPGPVEVFSSIIQEFVFAIYMRPLCSVYDGPIGMMPGLPAGRLKSGLVIKGTDYVGFVEDVETEVPFKSHHISEDVQVKISDSDADGILQMLGQTQVMSYGDDFLVL